MPTDASNIKGGDNPPFSVSDFKALSPQFQNDIVPDVVLEMYLELAHNAIKQARFHSYWKMAMGLFISHFATLWVMSAADPAGDAAGVVQAGSARGLDVSKSAGGVSVSKDYSLITGGLEGWGAWHMTTYGTQLATLAKMVTKGGMLVW